jgi:hypothetical protein
MNKQQLLDLKEESDQAKSEILEKNGRLNGLLDDLNSKWSCKDLQQAKAKKEELLGKKEEFREKIEQAIKEIENQLL